MYEGAEVSGFYNQSQQQTPDQQAGDNLRDSSCFPSLCLGAHGVIKRIL